MIVHKENKVLLHSQDKLFDLVADVKSYPQFLPWCLASRVHSKSDNFFIADLIVGFNIYREKFTSHVNINKKKFIIDVDYAEGPFNHLQNQWIFKKHSKGCEIIFKLEFEFSSSIIQNVIENLFSNAVKKMVFAFEQRANELYLKKIK